MALDFQNEQERKDHYKIQNRRTVPTGRVRQFSGTVGTSNTVVAFGETSREFHIQNEDTTNDLQFSFDDGANFWTLDAGETFRADIEAEDVTLLGAAADTDYEILIVF